MIPSPAVPMGIILRRADTRYWQRACCQLPLCTPVPAALEMSVHFKHADVTFPVCLSMWCGQKGAQGCTPGARLWQRGGVLRHI